MRAREGGRSCACGRGGGGTSGTVLLGSRRLGGRPSPKDPRAGWGGPGGFSAGAPLAAGPRGLRGCGLCFSQEEWPSACCVEVGCGGTWHLRSRGGRCGVEREASAERGAFVSASQDAPRRSVCLDAFPEMCGPGWKDELLLAEHRGAAAGRSCSEEACGRGFGLSAPGPKAAQPRETQQRRAG
eukprot:bmy_17946T0